LHQELDEQLGAEDETVATGPQVKNLPYLDACINEALRIHSTSALGLPRSVPEGGLTIRGQFFPQGTVLSVPSYSIHRDTSIWGEDVEQFRPERWLEGDEAAMHKTFNPFSVGPRSVNFTCSIVGASVTHLIIRIFFFTRACLGRNLAYLELQIIIASIMRRYDIVLEDPDFTVGPIYFPFS
jgi:benzoate 4-monooxygenase